MKVHIQRIASLMLVMALILSLSIVPSYATESSEVYNQGISNYLFETFGIKIQDFTSQLTMPFVGQRTYAELMECLRYYNSSFASAVGQALREGVITAAAKASFSDGKRATIQYDNVNNIYRIRDEFTQQWYVGYTGLYPYCTPEEYSKGTGEKPATEISTSEYTANQWIDLRGLANGTLDLVSYDVLSTAVLQLNERGIACKISQINRNVGGVPTMFYAIATVETWPKIYCDSSGYPWVAKVEPEKSAAETTYNYNTVVKVEDNSTNIDQITLDNSIKQEDTQIIDLTNAVLNLITDNGDKVQYNIDSVYWNEDNSSYTVNAYDIVNNNNFYEFNYYTYNIQYTYNNTYVTYIGSTAEYQPKEWALYYELPDGRSSADLTEEDIAGLSFQFNDVVNYKRSATDTSLRALYHFDGNTNDSSFFSTQGAFTWNTGASITYMESNAFNGALYLDEKTHDFTITLPSNIGSGDFSLQWRYYQNSATTSTNMDNYMTVGGQRLLQWSEQTLYNGSGTKVGDLSVGTWQELALVRNKGTLYLYHNGVKLASVALSSVLTNEIVFHLGPGSKAYAMLDELRFVNFAVAQSGAAYTPTAVPYDTNSVLVLPDGAVPVADEYWQWDTTIEPAFAFDLSSVMPTVAPSTVSTIKDVYGITRAQGYSVNSSDIVVGSVVTGNASNVFVTDSFTSFVYKGLTRGFSSGSGGSFSFSTNTDYWSVWSGFSSFSSAICVAADSGRYQYSSLITGDYTVSLIGADGARYSFPVSIPRQDYYCSTPVSFDWGSAFFCTITETANYEKRQFVALDFANVNDTFDLVYLEIVPGDRPNTGHKFVTAVYDANDLQPNTAAIQSDIPVKGYTVGGVRPTFPERGDVWFPVEGSRISGVYIYNGQAWEATNARWWTGKRWIPIYAFDLVTLQDCWDVTSSDGPGTEVTPPITSDYSFWNWWKSAWNDFTGRLFGILTPNSGNSPGSGTDPGGDPDPGSDDRGFFEKILNALADGISALIEGLFSVITEIFKTILTVVTDMLSAIFSFVTDTVLSGIKSFFSFFTDGDLFEFFQPAPDSEGVSLPEGIATVFGVFSGIIMLLPWELRSLLIFGVAALILMAVFKFAKS